MRRFRGLTEHLQAQSTHRGLGAPAPQDLSRVQAGRGSIVRQQCPQEQELSLVPPAGEGGAEELHTGFSQPQPRGDTHRFLSCFRTAPGASLNCRGFGK